MQRKIIIDCDPGIDDAVALAMALADPRLEVVAITATAGNVPADMATINTQIIVEALDPARFPRFGAATTSESAYSVDARHIHGEDGLGNLGLSVSSLIRRHPSEKIICDEARAAPGQVTLVCLGPLTNLARALQRDPMLGEVLSRVIIMGGAVACGGNITPAAEFNIYCDPESARFVFKSSLAITLAPLDVTNQVVFDLSLLNQLPAESTKAGKFLRRMMPFAFRAYRQNFGMETIHLHDAVALVALTNPELFEFRSLACDIETRGDVAMGATIFDRRPGSGPRGSIEVAMNVDAAAVADCVLRALNAPTGDSN